MKILIDNGHGIETPGKRSPDNSLREYKWAREIAERIVIELKRNGYDAERIVTEESDISLQERCRRVNNVCNKLGTKNVLLVSIHCNAAGADGKWKTAGGWCAYTTEGHTKSDMLANFLYKAAEEELTDYIKEFSTKKNAGYYDKYQKPIRSDYRDGDPDYEARFYILQKTLCPAVLTESLFQDNKEDVKYLISEDGKNSIVRLHVNGIINFIKSQDI